MISMYLPVTFFRNPARREAHPSSRVLGELEHGLHFRR